MHVRSVQFAINRNTRFGLDNNTRWRLALFGHAFIAVVWHLLRYQLATFPYTETQQSGTQDVTQLLGTSLYTYLF